MDKFAIRLNMSAVFDDVRKSSIILVDENWHSVECLQNRIKELWNVDVRLLNEDNCYIHPKEQIDIVKFCKTLIAYVPNESPLESKDQQPKVKKHKRVKRDENKALDNKIPHIEIAEAAETTSSMPALKDAQEISQPMKKKRKQKHFNDDNILASSTPNSHQTVKRVKSDVKSNEPAAEIVRPLVAASSIIVNSSSSASADVSKQKKRQRIRKRKQKTSVSMLVEQNNAANNDELNNSTSAHIYFDDSGVRLTNNDIDIDENASADNRNMIFEPILADAEADLRQRRSFKILNITAPPATAKAAILVKEVLVLEPINIKDLAQLNSIDQSNVLKINELAKENSLLVTEKKTNKKKKLERKILKENNNIEASAAEISVEENVASETIPSETHIPETTLSETDSKQDNVVAKKLDETMPERTLNVDNASDHILTTTTTTEETNANIDEGHLHDLTDKSKNETESTLSIEIDDYDLDCAISIDVDDSSVSSDADLPSNVIDLSFEDSSKENSSDTVIDRRSSIINNSTDSTKFNVRTILKSCKDLNDLPEINDIIIFKAQCIKGNMATEYIAGRCEYVHKRSKSIKLNILDGLTELERLPSRYFGDNLERSFINIKLSEMIMPKIFIET